MASLLDRDFDSYEEFDLQVFNEDELVTVDRIDGQFLDSLVAYYQTKGYQVQVGGLE